MGGLVGVNEYKGKALCVASDGNICFRSRIRDSKYDDYLVSFWHSEVLLFSSVDVR
jgi:hypothetical protein